MGSAMTQKFAFTLTVEVALIAGKFASRDEIAQAVKDQIVTAEPQSLYGFGTDRGSEYKVKSWEIETAVAGKKN